MVRVGDGAKVRVSEGASGIRRDLGTERGRDGERERGRNEAIGRMGEWAVLCSVFVVLKRDVWTVKFI